MNGIPHLRVVRSDREDQEDLVHLQRIMRSDLQRIMRSDPSFTKEPAVIADLYNALETGEKRAEGLVGHERIMKSQFADNWGHTIRVIKSDDDPVQDF